MKNRICVLSSAHLPTDIRLFYKQCRTLAGAGYDVTLIVQNDRDEERDGIHIKGISRPRNRLDRMLNLARQVYRRAVECDADIYHFHDPELIPVGLRLKRQGKKVIYDVHEDVPRQILSKSWIAEPLRRAISWTVEKLEDYAASRFDAIVTATEYIAKRFRELNGNVVAIHNYPINSDIVTDYSGLNKRRQICYISSHLSIERAIVPIVESMQYIDAELILAGRMTESVRMLVENLNGWEKTRYLGYVDQATVQTIIHESQAGIAIFSLEPNYVNALPTKMFEYMRGGLPVIVTDIPILRDIIDKYQCGVLVPTLDSREIANAINQVLMDSTKSEVMGKQGMRAIEEEYNWAAEAEKLVNLYANLVKT